MLIATHTLFGAFALAAGAAVLLRPKATRWHRQAGVLYVGAMVLLCVEAFGIRDSTPFFRGLGPFHILAVVSLVTVLGGYAVARRRRPGWFEVHYRLMAWSYVGLVMATGSHLFRPVFLFLLRDLGLARGLALGLTAGVLWGLPPLVGVALLWRRRAALERQAQPALAASRDG